MSAAAPAEVAKALGITVKVLDRLMDGRASFQVSTLQKVWGGSTR
jgi:hypothetical protein